MGPQRLTGPRERGPVCICTGFAGALHAEGRDRGANAPRDRAQSARHTGQACPLARGLAFPQTLHGRARGNSLDEKRVWSTL